MMNRPKASATVPGPVKYIIAVAEMQSRVKKRRNFFESVLSAMAPQTGLSTADAIIEMLIASAQ